MRYPYPGSVFRVASKLSARILLLSDQEHLSFHLGRNHPISVARGLLCFYSGAMNTIEKELLHRIITDRPFAEYITQRIDIGDFDDEVANRIYDGIVDLLCRGKRVSFEALAGYFQGDGAMIGELEIIPLHGDKS
jgi:hypothetical protein